MLSEGEQRALEDLERSLADGDEIPPVRRPPRWWASIRNWPWAAAVVIGSISVALMIEGAASGGLALAVAGALAWLLWRYWPQLREQGDLSHLADDDGAGDDSAQLRPAHRAPRHPVARRRAGS